MDLNLSNTPLVSIACITYNQSKYVREALESLLMQKINSPIEIIIHDDASTDGTAQIIKEYELKYPDLIIPIYQIENQYSKGVRRILKTFVFPRVRGKYIALCEGDDYWTDPYKLQKQVDFLESHPECVICFHNVVAVHYDKSQPDHIMCSPDQKAISTIEDLLLQNFIPTCSVMFRNHLVIEFPEWYFEIMQGDYPLYILLAQYGHVGYIDEVMANYRHHFQGIWSGANYSLNYPSMIFLYSKLFRNLDYKYRPLILLAMEKRINGLARTLVYANYEKGEKSCDEVKNEADNVWSTLLKGLELSHKEVDSLRITYYSTFYGALGFACHRKNDGKNARCYLLKAVDLDRQWLKNLGVWSVIIRS